MVQLGKYYMSCFHLNIYRLLSPCINKTYVVTVSPDHSLQNIVTKKTIIPIRIVLYKWLYCIWSSQKIDHCTNHHMNNFEPSDVGLIHTKGCMDSTVAIATKLDKGHLYILCR